MGPQVGHIRLLHVMLAASRMPVVVVAVEKGTEEEYVAVAVEKETEKNRRVCLASSSMPVVVVAVVLLVGAQQMAKISPKSA